MQSSFNIMFKGISNVIAANIMTDYIKDALDKVYMRDLYERD